MSKTRRVWIGTSGWTYDGWRGPFYPEEVRKKDWLRFYATQFPTTEINGSISSVESAVGSSTAACGKCIVKGSIINYRQTITRGRKGRPTDLQTVPACR